jgi:hypothetical protein
MFGFFTSGQALANSFKNNGCLINAINNASDDTAVAELK